MSNPRLKDVSGMRFGRLVAIRQSGNTKRGGALWECQCDCGNKKIVSGADLRNGHTQSCGCIHSEQLSKRNSKHNGYGTRLHNIWSGMKQRCGNPNAYNYCNYGGRGITVCDEWENSFEAFQEWAMAHGYRDDLTLDRIDNNGPYSPENCRWASRLDQGQNRQYNIKIMYNGETKTVREWSDELGIPADRIRDRFRKGLPPEKILSKENMNYRHITANGETHTIKEWASITGLDSSTISHRLKDGWTEAEAVTVKRKGGK